MIDDRIFTLTSLIAAAALTIGAYTPYLRGVFAGRVRPHLFSWVVWTALTGIGAGLQFAVGAIASASVTTMSTVGCAIVAVLAFSRGELDIRPSDRVSLTGAAAALAAWFVVGNPILATVLIVAVDAFGFYPTVRKSVARPHEETVSMYGLNAVRFTLGFLMAGTGSGPAAWLYPAYVVVTQAAFAAFLLLRRRMLVGAAPVAVAPTAGS